MPLRHPNSPLPKRDELQTIFEQRRPAYEDALSGLYRTVRSLLEANGYTPTIKYRLKRFNHYFGKLKKIHKGEKGCANGLITDLLGLRIICPFLEDLDIIEDLLATQFEIVEAERKGGQNSFREFGYDSVHMLIKFQELPLDEQIPHTANVCEIQLRTILQDAWAEVEHELVYKSDIALPNESIKRKLASLNATLTLSDLIFQEIRDYQKELRHRGHKRRKSIEQTLLGHDLISLTSPAELVRPAPREFEPTPYSLADGLEKIMHKALNAHYHNDFSSAIELYSQLIEMEMEARVRAMVFNHRGMAYFSVGDFTRASRDFTLSIQYDGDCFRSLINRGLVSRMLQQFDLSIDDYGRALQLDPYNHEGYFGRAQTFYEIQLFSKALVDCEKTLELQPDFPPAQQLIQLIHRGVFPLEQKPSSTSGVG